MKSQFGVSKFTAVLFGSLVLCVGLVNAQSKKTYTGGSKGVDILRLRNFAGLGNKSIVRTPEYDTSAARGSARAQMWQRLSISYDTAPEWIDEITVRYFAMSLTMVKGKKAYSIFKISERYSDIMAGKSHRSEAYLHPKAVARYGDVVAVAVEILNNGKVIAESSDVKGKSVPKDWWKNEAVTGSQSVTVRDGYLLPRVDSPFAFINIDDYEFAK